MSPEPRKWYNMDTALKEFSNVWLALFLVLSLIVAYRLA
jgi:hypothetical protein